MGKEYTRRPLETNTLALYCGIDPGISGSIVLIDSTLTEIHEIRLSNPIPHLHRFMDEYAPRIALALLERVRYTPGDGGKGSFTFGGSYHTCLNILESKDISHLKPTPSLWQSRMGILCQGNKKALKSAAESLFKGHKITLKNCDAFLLAKLALDTYTSI